MLEHKRCCIIEILFRNPRALIAEMAILMIEIRLFERVCSHTQARNSDFEPERGFLQQGLKHKQTGSILILGIYILIGLAQARAEEDLKPKAPIKIEIKIQTTNQPSTTTQEKPKQGKSNQGAMSIEMQENHFQTLENKLNQLSQLINQNQSQEEQVKLEKEYCTLLCEAGKLAHDLAAEKKNHYIRPALNYLESYLALEPRDAEARVYLGSIYVIKADSVNIFSKLKWAKKGFSQMDRAVDEAPHKPIVRLVRGANTFHIPKYLKRDQYGRQDFDFLIKDIDENPKCYEDELKKKTLYHAGKFAFKHDERENALGYFKRAQAISGNINLDAKLEKWLKKATALPIKKITQSK